MARGGSTRAAAGSGGFAFFGTTATMIAVINNVVAGAGIALLVRFLSPAAPRMGAAAAGMAAALAYSPGCFTPTNAGVSTMTTPVLPNGREDSRPGQITGVGMNTVSLMLCCKCNMS